MGLDVDAGREIGCAGVHASGGVIGMGRKRRLAALLAATALATPAAADERERLTVVLVGDTGLNMSGAPTSSLGGFKFDRVINADEAMRRIRGMIAGDVVFGNLETAVMDRNDLPARVKQFVFRTHPAAVKSFVQAGFNVFSLANNHALDYGPRGAGETLRHVSALEAEGLAAWPGLAETREAALEPHVFNRNGARIAVTAIGIGGGGLPAPPGSAGMLRIEDDGAAAIAALHNVKADLRILSAHQGAELSPFPDDEEFSRLRSLAPADGGATIAAGHHAHVAKGVELRGNRLIAYGLGNFLHFGMRNMAALDICRDFGLMLRVTLSRASGDAFSIESVEALPLTDMHVQTRVLDPADAAMRVDVLNYLSAAFDDPVVGARGLRFAPQADGRGLWCAETATSDLCREWRAPPLASDARLEEIKVACGRTVRRPLVAGLEDAPVWPAAFTLADTFAAHEAASRSLPPWLGETVNLRAANRLAAAQRVRYRLTGVKPGAEAVTVDFEWDPQNRRMIGPIDMPAGVTLAADGFEIDGGGGNYIPLQVPDPLAFAVPTARDRTIKAGGRLWSFALIEE